MSSAIELTNFRAQPQPVPQPKKKTIFKYTFTCGDVVYSEDGSKPATHICKKVKPKPQIYLVDERYEKLSRQLDEYRTQGTGYRPKGGPTLYDDFRSSFTDKDLKYILSNKI